MFKKQGRPEWSKKEGEAAAIEYCISEIIFYEDAGVGNRRRWKIWQYIVIIFGSLATLAATVNTIPSQFGAPAWINEWLGLFRAVPAAIATIAASIMSVYNYKAEHVRQGATHDALNGELVKFRSRAQPYDKCANKNVSLFVSNIRRIVQNELQIWQSVFTTPDNRPPPDP